MLGAGDMGGGGDNTTWIVVAVVAALLAAAVLYHRSSAAKARARVASSVHPDTGVVALHDLPAPGARVSVAIGLRVTPDPSGEVLLSEAM